MDPEYGLNEFGVDAGMLYVGGNPIGPTVGGLQHQPGEQWRVLERDGGTTEKAGTSRITGYDTHLTGRVKDMRDEFHAYHMPGSASDGSSDSSGYSSNNVRTPSDAREFFAEGDFIQNVWYVYRVHDPVNGRKYFNAWVYPLMRAEATPQSGEDSNEQIKEIDWKAILLEGQADTDPPFFHVEGFDVASFDIDDYVTYATP